MRLNQDEETRGKDSKGKEIAAGNRSRITTPPLSFLAILDEHGIPPLDTSCPDQLRRQLYDGVFLKPNKLKFYVDEESNKNCFVLFARELIIVHFEKPQYWQWVKDKETRWDQVGTNCGKIGELMIVYSTSMDAEIDEPLSS